MNTEIWNVRTWQIELYSLSKKWITWWIKNSNNVKVVRIPWLYFPLLLVFHPYLPLREHFLLFLIFRNFPTILNNKLIRIPPFTNNRNRTESQRIKYTSRQYNKCMNLLNKKQHQWSYIHLIHSLDKTDKNKSGEWIAPTFRQPMLGTDWSDAQMQKKIE